MTTRGRARSYWDTCKRCGHDVKDHFPQPGEPCAICESQDDTRCASRMSSEEQQAASGEPRGIALAIDFKQRQAAVASDLESDLTRPPTAPDQSIR